MLVFFSFFCSLLTCIFLNIVCALVYSGIVRSRWDSTLTRRHPSSIPSKLEWYSYINLFIIEKEKEKIRHVDTIMVLCYVCTPIWNNPCCTLPSAASDCSTHTRPALGVDESFVFWFFLPPFFYPIPPLVRPFLYSPHIPINIPKPYEFRIPRKRHAC